jgi:hypothetical protein
MGNLPPNATPLVSRFLAEMSKKRQRSAVVNLEIRFRQSLPTFTVIVSSNNYSIINGKMGCTIEDKAVFINNYLINRYDSNQEKRFDKAKNEVALIFDHLVYFVGCFVTVCLISLFISTSLRN